MVNINVLWALSVEIDQFDYDCGANYIVFSVLEQNIISDQPKYYTGIICSFSVYYEL